MTRAMVLELRRKCYINLEGLNRVRFDKHEKFDTNKAFNKLKAKYEFYNGLLKAIK